MHVILILGLQDEEANYSSEIKKFEHLKGIYKNSSHCLFDNFDNFSVIATKKALEMQKELLGDERFAKVKNTEIVTPNDVGKIFDAIIKITKKIDDDIILDLTHSFRTHSIVAALSALMSRKKRFELIYAQDQDGDYKNFKYISLNRYLDIGLISLALDSFKENLIFNRIFGLSNLHEFSKRLQANEIKKALSYIKYAQNDLNALSKDMPDLDEQIKGAEEILEEFSEIQSKQKNHQQFYELALIMHKYHYNLIALTYAYEAINEKCFNELRQFIKNEKFRGDDRGGRFDKIKIVNKFIRNEGLKKPDEKNTLDYEKALDCAQRQGLFKLKHLLTNINAARNQLVHLEVRQDKYMDFNKLMNEFENTFKAFL